MLLIAPPFPSDDLFEKIESASSAMKNKNS